MAKARERKAWRARVFFEAAQREVAARFRVWEAELEEVLERLLGQAAEAWPRLVTPKSEEAFVRYLAARVRVQDDLKSLGSLHADDLGLAFGCVQGDPQASSEVRRRIVGDPVRVQRHLKASASFVDELFQVLSITLLVGEPPDEPGIGNYSGRGTLKSWLGAATFHAAMNLRRGRANQPTAQVETESLSSELSDPELSWIRERHRKDFNAAFREALQAQTSRDRNVLRLYFVDGLSVESIGKLYQVNRSTISRQLAATRGRVLQGVRATLVRQLRLDPAQADSLLRLLTSQLDVSLTTCLGSIPEN
jgi:RNA polymerase sigma-70 factor (ECF subfamily)